MYNEAYYKEKKNNIFRKFAEKKEKFVGKVIELANELTNERKEAEEELQAVMRDEEESKKQDAEKDGAGTKKPKKNAV